MKLTPIISEKSAAIFTWIGTAVFTIGRYDLRPLKCVRYLSVRLIMIVFDLELLRSVW
jgi:hypothetical protein